MARMIPSQPDADTPGSERRVFDCLSVALPDRWTVFHARRFTLPSRHGEPTRELELDFLVLAPDRGLPRSRAGAIRRLMTMSDR
jgi:hypothetical protein